MDVVTDNQEIRCCGPERNRFTEHVSVWHVGPVQFSFFRRLAPGVWSTGAKRAGTAHVAPRVAFVPLTCGSHPHCPKTIRSRHFRLPISPARAHKKRDAPHPLSPSASVWFRSFRVWIFCNVPLVKSSYYENRLKVGCFLNF